MSSFPYFAVDSNVYPTYSMPDKTIEEEDVLELNKDVLNYISYEELIKLNNTQKLSLKNHTLYLYNSYFKKGEGAVDTQDINNVVFRYTQWNTIKKYIENYESYCNSNFIINLNSFISTINQSFVLFTQNMNIYFKNLNYIYSNNIFLDGNALMNKIEKVHFSEELKEFLDNYNKGETKLLYFDRKLDSKYRKICFVAE